MNAVRKIDANVVNLWSEKYHEKQDDQERCIVCGKKTSPKVKGLGVIVIDGGSSIVHPDDNDVAVANQPGAYMGWWPVGSECIKPIPKEFRTKLQTK